MCGSGSSTLGTVTNTIFPGVGSAMDAVGDYFHPSSVGAPGASPADQLTQMQLEDLENQRKDIENFKPFVLQQYGLQDNYSKLSAADTEKLHLIDQAKADVAKGLTPAQLQSKYGRTALALNANTPIEGTSGYLDATRGKILEGAGLTADTPQYGYTPEQEALNTKLEMYKKTALELADAQQTRQKQAIAGTLPLSQQLLQQRDKDFATLKEDQGRNGNEIVGDSFENAVAKTTSGQQALESLRKTYGLLADNEQRAAINDAALPSVYQSSYSNTSTPGAPNPAMLSLNPSYYSAAYQPYQFGQTLASDTAQFNAKANNSFKNTLLTGLLSAGGRVAGAAAA